MYEEMTYEVILQRMLDRVPDTFDKREGSVIYDALSPAAVELALIYIQFDMILNESFGDTASREYLIRRAAERGIKPEPATNAILKGIFTPRTLDMTGKRFNMQNVHANYVVTEQLSEGVYKVQCETTGINGNICLGRIIPIDYIEGLETATLTELLIPGEDAEDTEKFRTRYFDSFESQAFGGNVADYVAKTEALAGVSGVKVYPAWNGGGTVKLVIINSAFEKPSSTLIDAVQTAIDPILNQGKGVGLAPIGHVVTVLGVQNTIVQVSTTVTYQEGWTEADVKPYAEKAIAAYFKELATSWAHCEALVVRISQIETRLLSVEGILDIINTLLNGTAANLILPVHNIPVLGGFIA